MTRKYQKYIAVILFVTLSLVLSSYFTKKYVAEAAPAAVTNLAVRYSVISADLAARVRPSMDDLPYTYSVSVEAVASPVIVPLRTGSISIGAVPSTRSFFLSTLADLANESPVIADTEVFQNNAVRISRVDRSAISRAVIAVTPD